jgi:hypothetical protein
MNVMACYRQPRIESVGFWIPHESAMIGEAKSISFFEAFFGDLTPGGTSVIIRGTGTPWSLGVWRKLEQ